MLAFYGTRLSEHISESPEGFLIAHAAPLCRTAVNTPQKYLGSELGLRNDDRVYDVYRSPKEVLNKKFLASLEGKPVTDAHPPGFLTADTASWYQRGHAQNIRIGPVLPDGEQSVIGDLLITDRALIDKVKNGLRELSVGYAYDLKEDGQGALWQTELKGNHIAIVPEARGGAHLRINDSAAEESFEQMAGRYHRNPNPNAVERERNARRAEDGRRADLSGEPKSWDAAGKELSELMTEQARRAGAVKSADGNEDTMVDEALILRLIETINRLTEAIESGGLSSRSADAEDEAMDSAHPAMENLRAIRPFVMKSGDRQAIDSFNRAVKALKREAQYRGEIVDAADWWRRVPDGQSHAKDSRQSQAEDFGKSAGRYHRKNFHVREDREQPPAEDTRAREAADAAETFDDKVSRHRKRLLDRKS